MLALVLSGSGPVLLRNPIFPCFFEGAGGGGRTPVPQSESTHAELASAILNKLFKCHGLQWLCLLQISLP